MRYEVTQLLGGCGQQAGTLGGFRPRPNYRKVWLREGRVHGSGSPFRISITYTAFTFTPNAIRYDAKPGKQGGDSKL